MTEQKKIQQRSAKEWAHILQEYETRDCTKTEFLTRHNIKPWALKYHQDKARQKPAVFAPVSSVAETSNGEVAVEFPSGIRLLIRG